jgi:hypothetical protein
MMLATRNCFLCGNILPLRVFSEDVLKNIHCLRNAIEKSLAGMQLRNIVENS